MLIGLLALMVSSVAVTTFFLIYNKDEKKEDSVKEDDAQLNNVENLADMRDNLRGVENMFPIPTPQVVNYSGEHFLNDERKKENTRINVR